MQSMQYAARMLPSPTKACYDQIPMVSLPDGSSWPHELGLGVLPACMPFKRCNRCCGGEACRVRRTSTATAFRLCAVCLCSSHLDAAVTATTASCHLPSRASQKGAAWNPSFPPSGHHHHYASLAWPYEGSRVQGDGGPVALSMWPHVVIQESLRQHLSNTSGHAKSAMSDVYNFGAITCCHGERCEVFR